MSFNQSEDTSGDELFNIQLEIALAESLVENSIYTSSAELAYFTDLNLVQSDDMIRPPSFTNNNRNNNDKNNSSITNQKSVSTGVRTSYRPVVALPQMLANHNNNNNNNNNNMNIKAEPTINNNLSIPTRAYPNINNSKETSNIQRDNNISNNNPSLPKSPIKSTSSSGDSKSSLFSSFFSSTSRSPTVVCHKCKNSIIMGDYLTALGNTYHKECFTCDGCNRLIQTQFVNKGDPPMPYHAECAIELFNPKCTLCSNSIQNQYYKHPFFENEKYCMDIQHESRKDCFSCNRKEPMRNKDSFIHLPDGRSLCLQCSSTIIIDSSEAASLYKDVIKFFENDLKLQIPLNMKTVPILAVDLSTMNEHKKNAFINIHQGNNSSSFTRGLTISARGEIRHIMNRSLGFNHIQSSVYRIEETREVSAVLVLYGLPKDLTASILAHEAFHVWLKLNKRVPFDLVPLAEEGLCQTVSHRFLHNLSTIETSGEDLRSYYRYQIEIDPNPIYGDGYRKAKKCIDNLGLDITIDHLISNKQLPDI